MAEHSLSEANVKATERTQMSVVTKRYAVSIVAIIAIGFIEGMALLQGIDGTMMVLSIGAIAGLGGYQIGRIRRE